MSWLRSFQPTRLQILDEDVNRRNNTQRKNGTDEQAPKDNRPDRLLSVSSGIPCNNKGKETCQRGNGRHQNWSQSRFCSFESRFSCPQAISHTLISKFHNKNGILCSKSNQHEQTHLGKDIDIH